MKKLFLLFVIINNIIFPNISDSLYNFIQYDKNIISNSVYLNSVFEKYTKNKKIRILHIGDSFLVSGYLGKSFIENIRSDFNIKNASLIGFDANKKKYKKRYIKRNIIINKTLIENSDTIGVEYLIFASSGKTYEYFYRNTQLSNIINEYHPDLIIISLGINDAMNMYLYEEFYKIVEAFYKKYENSEIKFLLTTPIDFITKKRKNNITLINSVIKDFSNSKSIAYYDFYEISGGKGARVQWYKVGLSNKDLIHLKPEGYNLQGKLFAEAFLRAYNEYRKNYK